MKDRTYLEEDLHLIQKYFPGAKTMTIRTPFDLDTARGGGHAAQVDPFRVQPESRWYGDLRWEPQA